MPTTKAKTTKPPISEAAFQQKIIKHLRSKKCLVYKMQQNATTKIGTPDILFLKEGFWGALEVKKSKSAKFQIGQKEMVEKMNEMSYARVIYPENYDEVMAELDFMLKD